MSSATSTTSTITSDCHRLVWSPEQIRDFYTRLFALSQPLGDCQFQLQILAREKYIAPLRFRGGANMQIRSVNIHSDRGVERIAQKISQLEARRGAYTLTLSDSECEISVPDQCIVVVTSINPPDVKEVHSLLMADLMCGVVSHTRFEKELQSRYTKSASKRSVLLRDLDIDTKDATQLRWIVDILFPRLTERVFDVIETRNGFHVLYSHKGMSVDASRAVDECVKEGASRKFTKTNRIGETVTDTFVCKSEGGIVPLPGCYQGGFMVKSWKLTDWLKWIELEAVTSGVEKL
jgi:hypothetical protein